MVAVCSPENKTFLLLLSCLKHKISDLGQMCLGQDRPFLQGLGSPAFLFVEEMAGTHGVGQLRCTVVGHHLLCFIISIKFELRKKGKWVSGCHRWREIRENEE